MINFKENLSTEEVSHPCYADQVSLPLKVDSKPPYVPKSVGQVKAKADNLLGVYKRPIGNLNDYEDLKSQRSICE